MYTLHPYKGSAIHNLRVRETDADATEGLHLSRRILEEANLTPGQTVVVTRIHAGNQLNRIYTIVHEVEGSGTCLAGGALSSFLRKEDLTCVIAYVYLDRDQRADYIDGKIPVFDLGFDPNDNLDNQNSNLILQSGATHKGLSGNWDFHEAVSIHNGLCVQKCGALISGMTVTSEHPDCLQGSAEVPGEVLNGAGMSGFEAVTVYNVDTGTSADTYAVPMERGVVMTTGAMAAFAPTGSRVALAAFSYAPKGDETPLRKVVTTPSNTLPI